MKRLTGSVLVAAALWLTACRDATDPLSEDRGPSAAEIAAAELGIVVPDQFIVVFNDDVEDPPELAAEFAAAYGGQILFTYRTAIKGFAVRIPRGPKSSRRMNSRMPDSPPPTVSATNRASRLLAPLL